MGERALTPPRCLAPRNDQGAPRFLSRGGGVMATADTRSLSVFLSASVPDELSGTSRAQDFFDFLVVVAGGVLSAGGRLIFGGHPSVTPLLHRVVEAMRLG